MTILSINQSLYLDYSGVPARLCSLRVILLLEDMGTTGDPHDKVIGVLEVLEYLKHLK